MNGEGRIPPLLIAGLVFLVLAIGALAYYAGRFGRPEERPSLGSAVELPPPAAPDPAVSQVFPTPPEVPPTVTPAVSVLIERETRTTRSVRSGPLVERSSEIEVRVPAVIPTARVPEAGPTPLPTPRRQIVVDVLATPIPQPTPTPPRGEGESEEVQEVEEEPLPPDTTPEPEPTRRASRR
ncbi:MAG TPA: hypothetical protein VNC59_04430 [Thermoanaerobaculia bacterium]|nr:hypothetical protein [Thermoanaerobaculia bacterium]